MCKPGIHNDFHNDFHKSKSTPKIDALIDQWFLSMQEYAQRQGIADLDQVAYEFAKNITKNLI